MGNKVKDPYEVYKKNHPEYEEPEVEKTTANATVNTGKVQDPFSVYKANHPEYVTPIVPTIKKPDNLVEIRNTPSTVPSHGASLLYNMAQNPPKTGLMSAAGMPSDVKQIMGEKYYVDAYKELEDKIPDNPLKLGWNKAMNLVAKVHKLDLGPDYPNYGEDQKKLQQMAPTYNAIMEKRAYQDLLNRGITEQDLYDFSHSYMTEAEKDEIRKNLEREGWKDWDIDWQIKELEKERKKKYDEAYYGEGKIKDIIDHPSEGLDGYAYLNVLSKLGEENNMAWAQDNPLTASFGSVVMNPFEATLGVVKKGDQYLTGKAISADESFGEQSRRAITDSINSGAGKLAYSGGMSIADTAYSAAIARATGGGTAVSSGIQGLEKANQVMNEGVQRGLTPTQIILEGIASGLSTAGTEAIPMGKFEEIAEKGISNYSAKEISKVLGSMALTEGAQEGAEDLVDWTYDAIIAGDKNKFNQDVQNYISQGMSQGEAVLQTSLDRVKEAGTDMAIGGLSGFGLGTAGISAGYVNQSINENPAVITDTIWDNLNAKEQSPEAFNMLAEAVKNIDAETSSNSAKVEKAQEIASKPVEEITKEDIVDLANVVMEETSRDNKLAETIQEINYQAAVDSNIEQYNNTGKIEPREAELPVEQAARQKVESIVVDAEREYYKMREAAYKNSLEKISEEFENEKAAQLFKENYKNQPVSMYSAVSNQAYRAGESGQSYETFKENTPYVETSIEAGIVTEDYLKRLYYLGYNTRSTDFKNATLKSAENIGKIIGETEEELRQFEELVTKKFGYSIKHVGSEAESRGRMDTAIAQMILGVVDNAYSTTIHETFEDARAYNAKGMEIVTRALTEMIVKKSGERSFIETVESYKQAYRQAGKDAPVGSELSQEANKSFAEAQDEFINDAAAYFFSTEQGMRNLIDYIIDDDAYSVKEKKNAIQAIKDLVDNLIKNIRKYISEHENRQLGYKFVEELEWTADELDGISRMLIGALEDARLNKEAQIKALKGEVENGYAEETLATEESIDAAHSIKVEDKKTLNFLENQEHIKTYRTFQQIGDGLYAPMNAMENGKLGYKSVLGQWEQATEAPELAKLNEKNGNYYFDLKAGGFTASGKSRTTKAAYNPYLHSSNLVFNDQFAGAYDRPNLVVVECEVPSSETTSGYHAEKAKDPVGWLEWKSGQVANALKKKGIERKVMLSRWMKPIRILDNAEVAEMYKEALDGTNIVVPWNVVSPPLLTELEKVGVDIDYGYQSAVKASYEDKFGDRASHSIEVEYNNSTDQGLLRYINNYLSDVNVKNYYTLESELSKELVDKISELVGFSVEGYKEILPKNSLRHIEKRHGINGIADTSMKDPEDIARINYAINNHDRIALSDEVSDAYKNKDNTPAKTIKIVKKIGDNYYYVVEAVPDNLSKSLVVLTAYRNTNDTFDRVPDANNSPMTNGRAAHEHDVSFTDSNITESVEKSNTQDTEIIEKALQDIPEKSNFSVNVPVEQTKDLIAVHNLSAEKLQGALELGGFPMPSIAITKADMDHSKFGPISVVFRKGTIDPKANKANKVYSGDAYTPTFPRIGYKVDNQKVYAVEDRLNDILGDMKDAFGYMGIDSDNIADYLERNNGDIAQAYGNKEGLQYAFAKEKGIAPKLATKEARLTWRFENSDIKNVAKLFTPEETLDIEQHSSERYKQFSKDGTLQRIIDQINKGEQEYLGPLYKNHKTTSLEYADFDYLLHAVYKYYKEGIPEEVDKASLNKDLKEVMKGHEEEYTKWLNDLFDGVVSRRGIRNNKDTFTSSGNRRSWDSLHDDYTLENIVRAMKGEPEVGQSLGGWTLLGSINRKFDSIEDIHSEEDRLQMMDDDEYSERRSEIQDALYEVAKGLKPNPEWDVLSICSDIAEAAAKRKTKSGIKSFLSEWYNVSDADMNEIMDIIAKAKSLPTGYFEAKPQRAVGLDEVAAFVIPSDDTEIASLLDEKGLPYVEYKRGDKESRVEAVNSVDDVAFSLDVRYDEAYKNNNFEKMNEIIRQAAIEAGYDSPELYHGTMDFGFTQIDLEKMDDKMSFFATDNIDLASTYSGTNKTRGISESGKISADEIAKALEETGRWKDVRYLPAGDKKARFEYLKERFHRMSSFAKQNEKDLYDRELMKPYRDFMNELATQILFEKIDMKTLNQLMKPLREAHFVISDYAWDLYNAILPAREENLNKNVYMTDGSAKTEEDARDYLPGENWGIYKFYGKTDNLLEVDGKGSYWYNIRFDGEELNTREIAKRAKEQGYDGVIIRNIFDDGGRNNNSDSARGNIYIFFDPEKQVKSADTVTYDDNGEVIPPSERFKEENNDIRHSLAVPVVDNQGRKLSEGQAEYFKDSKIVDDKGRLKIMYHGTENGGFTVFDPEFSDDGISLFFTDDVDVARAYSSTKDEIKFLKTVKDLEDIIHSSYTHIVQDGDEYKIITGFDEDAEEEFSGTFDELKDYVEEMYGDPNKATNYKVYLNATNPLVVDCKGNLWNELPEVIEGLTTTREYSAYAKENGYDSVIFNNVGDSGIFADFNTSLKNSQVVVVFNSNQVKSVENLNPTEDEDIRYSLNVDYDSFFDAFEEIDEKATVDTSDLHKFLEDLGDIESEATKKSIAEVVRNIKKQYHSSIDTKALEKGIKGLFTYMKSTGKISMDDVMTVAAELAKPVLSTMEEVDPAEQEAYDKFLDAFKGYKIALDDGQTQEVRYKYGSYYDFKRAMSGKVEFNKNGVPLDNIWTELCDKSGGVLSYGTNPNEQPIAIAEAIESFTPKPYSLDGESLDTAAQNLALEMFRQFFVQQSMSDAAEKVKTTMDKRVKAVRDLYKQKLNDAIKTVEAEKTVNMKRLAAEIESLTEEEQEAIRNGDTVNQALIENIRQDYKKRYERLQAQTNDKIVQAKAKYQNAWVKKNITRETSDLKHRLLREVQALQNIIAHPKEGASKHVPINLIKPTIEMLEAINLDNGGRNKTIVERLKKMSEVYESFKNDESYSFDYDERIAADIAELRKMFENRSYADLNIPELQRVLDIVKALKTQILNANNLILNGKYEDAQEASKKAIKDVENSRRHDNAAMNALNKYANIHLNAYREFRKLSGYKDGELMKIYRDLDEGSKREMQIQKDLGEIFANVLEGNENQKEVKRFISTKPKDLVDIGITDKNGKPIKITRAMRMSLIMHAMNAGNMRHILGSGITVPNMYYFEKGKLDEAYAKGTNYRFVDFQELLQAMQNNDMNKVKELSKAAQDRIEGLKADLNEWEKQFLADAEEMFHEKTGELINDTSMQLKGYALARVKNYFPIRTDSHFTKQEWSGLVRDGSLEGMGMLKERVISTKPILLEDITNVIQRQIKNVSKYAGYAVPVRNFETLMKQTSRNQQTGQLKNLYETIDNTWGASDSRWLQNLMQDIQGGRHEKSNFLMDLRGKFAGATLTLNPSVAIKQAASYPTAAAVVGYKALGRAMADIGRGFGGKGIAELEKINPLLWYRMQGYGTQELADAKASGFGKNLPVWAQKATNWTQWFDTGTVRTLEYAAKYYVDDNFKNLKEGTDEYWQKVSDVFSKIVEETQPNYSTLQKADIIRDPNSLKKMLVMFKTQPMQNFGIIYDAMGELNAAKVSGNKAWIKEASSNAALAVSSQVVSASVFSAMTILAQLLLHRWWKYRDDDGEWSWKKLLTAFGEGVLSCMTGALIGGSELYEALKHIFTGSSYYGIEVSVAEMVNDFVENVGKITKNAKGLWDAKTSEDKEKAAQKLLGASINLGSTVGEFKGTPVNNIKNMLSSMYFYVTDIVNSIDNGELTFSDDSNITTWDIKTQYQRIYEALQSGNTSKYDKLVQELVNDTKADNPDLTDEEVAEKVEKKVSDKITDMLKEGWLEGEVTDEEMSEYLTEEAGKTEDEAYFQMRKWETGETSDYGVMKDLINTASSDYSAETRRAVIEEVDNLLAHGKTKEGIASTLTSTYKAEYIELYKQGKAADLNAILRAALVEAGYTDDKAKKKLEGWLK